MTQPLRVGLGSALGFNLQDSHPVSLSIEYQVLLQHTMYHKYWGRLPSEPKYTIFGPGHKTPETINLTEV